MVMIVVLLLAPLALKKLMSRTTGGKEEELVDST
jgi:hypothetical protein